MLDPYACIYEELLALLHRSQYTDPVLQIQTPASLAVPVYKVTIYNNIFVHQSYLSRQVDISQILLAAWSCYFCDVGHLPSLAPNQL